ncbi:hypothetical protein NEOKW01_0928 [Nematocida sp. AWRm80]|nr:hypothetical protein NEOKW01_0928 [Nematocida sp. AWRm80]
MFVYDLVIIGKNVSALTAVIYAAMAKDPMVHIACPNEEHTAVGVNNYLGNIKNDYNTFWNSVNRQTERFEFERVEQDVKSIVIKGSEAHIKLSEREIKAKAIIISTKETLELIDTTKATDKKVIFKCGTALNNSLEQISLAGTGCIAAIDARNHLSSH